MVTKGNYQEQFQTVKDAFEELHATGRETGSSFAVYQDGIPLIDIWGGHRDKEKKLAWEQNTLANVWSTTKGVAATCVALMVEKGARLFDAGEACGAEANMAKMLASEASWRAGDMCMQTHGGFAFSKEYHIERKFRETRLYQIAPISTNLILSYIGEHVLELPRSF